jgi:Glyoxalase-like domain
VTASDAVASLQTCDVLRHTHVMTNGMTELDHIFLIVSDEQNARALMDSAGLRVNYTRIHEGQGTRNLCACLDDMFLELLWLDGSAIHAETERISLASRGRGLGSPIGISWRGICDLEQVHYAAPFLPSGVSIPVARASLDPALPFVFRTPGGIRPIDRTDGLVGDRQSPYLTVLGHCEIIVPNPEVVAALLKGFDHVSVSNGEPSLHIQLLNSQGEVGREFTWPSATDL